MKETFSGNLQGTHRGKLLDVSKHKCNVPVYSTQGCSYTTKRGARRLEERGLADRLPSGGLRMRETDHRFQCEAKEPAPARPVFVIRWWPQEWDQLPYEGMPAGQAAHYPLPDQTTPRRLRRAA